MDRLTRWLDSEIKDAEETFNKWRTRIADDTRVMMTLSGSSTDSALRAAANMTVYSSARQLIPDVGIEAVRQDLLHDVLSSSKYPERSSSPTFNIIAQNMLAAKAILLEKINDEIGAQGS